MLTFLSLLGDKRSRFYGTLPALLVSEPIADVYLLIIDSVALPRTRVSAEEGGNQAFLKYDNGK